MDPITATAFSKIARIDPPKVDPRTGLEEAKKRVRIVCTNLMQVLPGGHLVERGENLREVYVSDLKEIHKLVETATDENRSDADREYERQLRAWRKGNEGVDERACPISFEAAFRHVMGRDLLPLELVEVLDDGKKGTSKAA